MSSTCSDATGSSFDLAASEPCPPGRGAGPRKDAGLDGCCGGADDVEDVVGLGQHGAVTAVELVGGGAHPLGGGRSRSGWTAWSFCRRCTSSAWSATRRRGRCC